VRTSAQNGDNVDRLNIAIYVVARNLLSPAGRKPPSGMHERNAACTNSWHANQVAQNTATRPANL
jgi:hypothetical protein